MQTILVVSSWTVSVAGVARSNIQREAELSPLEHRARGMPEAMSCMWPMEHGVSILRESNTIIVVSLWLDLSKQFTMFIENA